MQVLAEPRLTTEQEDVHLLDTFLFSSKMNEAGWKVNKDAIDKIAQKAIGTDFYAIPERIFKPLKEGRGGHPAEGTKEQELSEIRKNSIGTIVSVKRYEYGDGDVYYNAKVRLNGSKAASTLIENGSKTWTPFAVSPHIWPLQGNDDDITDAEFLGLSLVIKGAYGDQAVVNKYCSGSSTVCEKSLSAAIQDVITSLSLNNENKGIMSTQVQELNPNAGLKQEPTQPIKQEEVKKEETVSLTKAEFQALQEQLEATKQKDQQLSELIKENKTTKLNNIFKSVKDESLKKTLTEKYFNADVNQLNEFYQDITNHVVPSLIDEAKAAAEQDLKSKTIEENKGKSKAGSTALPKEPEVPKDNQVVPKNQNEILKLRRIMEGGF